MRQMVGQIIKMRGALWVNAFLYYFSRLWMLGRLVPPAAYAGYRAKKALSAAAVAVRQIIDLCGKPLYLLTFLVLPVILLAARSLQGRNFLCSYPCCFSSAVSSALLATAIFSM